MIRALVLAVLALAAAPVAADAAVPPALGPDGRVFPIVGGGKERPRDGLPASRLRIGLLLAAAPLADGSVAVVPLNDEPFAVGTDGRIRLLPELPDASSVIEGLEGAADGALLALRGGNVHLLEPGAGGWTRLARPGPVPASARLTDLVTLPRGYALIGRRALWRVESGTVVRVPLPALPSGAAALPDGTIVLGFFDDDRLIALPPAGPQRELRPVTTTDDFWGPLIALPGGGLVGSRFDPLRIEMLGPDAALEGTLRPRSGLGPGDGGPFEHQGDFPLAVTPDGAFLLPGGPDFQLRLAVPPGTTRALAAVTRAAYAGLRRGTVTVASTVAGVAAIQVRSGGEVVASARTEIGAGTTDVQLEDPPPPGDYRVALTLTASDGREARHRLRVVTLRRLARSEALRVARRYERQSRSRASGFSIDLRRCERDGARRFRCQAVQIERRPGPDGRVCVGVWSVRLRPDGERAGTREAPRACRKLGPVR